MFILESIIKGIAAYGFVCWANSYILKRAMRKKEKIDIEDMMMTTSLSAAIIFFIVYRSISFVFDAI